MKARNLTPDQLKAYFEDCKTLYATAAPKLALAIDSYPMYSVDWAGHQAIADHYSRYKSDKHRIIGGIIDPTISLDAANWHRGLTPRIVKSATVRPNLNDSKAVCIANRVELANALLRREACGWSQSEVEDVAKIHALEIEINATLDALDICTDYVAICTTSRACRARIIPDDPDIPAYNISVDKGGIAAYNCKYERPLKRRPRSDKLKAWQDAITLPTGQLIKSISEADYDRMSAGAYQKFG